MSETIIRPQRAVLLWLSGARLADIRALPIVSTLIDGGATVELDPSPITGRQSQRYQLFSGKAPASFGFFDSFAVRSYTVAEEANGRGPAPKLLPDLLRTVGWTVAYEETQLPDLPVQLRKSAQSVAADPACLIIKCLVNGELNDADKAVISGTLAAAQAWVGEHGLLAVCSDTQPVVIQRFVNINDFLADMGVIEREEQSGQISWENSLAYFAGNGQLLINLLGRDARGAVHPQDEAEEVSDTLVKALPNKLRDPDSGEAVIERVYRKSELYGGDYLFCAPDLVVVFQPGYAPSPHSRSIGFDGAAFVAPEPGQQVTEGVHPSQATGFLIAKAPTLAERVTEYEHQPLTSLVPTILHALGIEYADMDSAAIGTLFSYDYLETHPIRGRSHNQELSEEDEELIISHLRDLGYV